MEPGAGNNTHFREAISPVETLAYKYIIQQIAVGAGLSVKHLFVAPEG